MNRYTRPNFDMLPRWPLAAVGLLALIAALLIPPPPLEANSAPAAPTGLTAAAGDQSVTLTWNDPGDASITRYEYNVNHNDTSTGNLSGWGPWTNIPNSGSSTTSYTHTGLTNGREYRYHLRAVNDNGPSVGAPDFGPPWYVSAIPAGPPAAPTGLAATGGNQSVTLSWNNPGDDSIIRYEYNVNHNATGTGNFTGWSPWTAIPNSGTDTTSYTHTGLTNGREYRYHLRAVNNTGPSVGAPADGPPWFASATPTSPDPDPPTNLRVERVCDHHLKVRWHRSAGATGYDLKISGNHRKSWQRLLTNWPGNSWYATWWDVNRTYYFAVRSVNDGGTSEWVNSAASVAPPCAVDNLRAVTGTSHGTNGGSISATWNAGKRANAYHVEYGGARQVSDYDSTSHTGTVASKGSYIVSVQSTKDDMTSEWRNVTVDDWLTVSDVKATSVKLNLTGHSGQWWYQADTGPDSACQGPVATVSEARDGLTLHHLYTYSAYRAAGCNDADLMASIIFEPSGDVLKVESITATTATLKIENHTGDWWFKETSPATGTCTKGEADFTNALTGLIPGTEYTYKSYDVSNCGDGHVGARVDFTTGGVSVSRLEEGGTGVCLIGYNNTYSMQCAPSFTTGGATNGYTLHSVTAKFDDSDGSPSALVVALHAYALSGDRPADDPIPNATFTGNSPVTGGDYTYTCSGSGCQLSKNRSYFVAMRTLDNIYVKRYHLLTTTSNDETNIPSDNGWSISDTIWVTQGSTVGATPSAGRIKVSATAR